MNKFILVFAILSFTFISTNKAEESISLNESLAANPIGDTLHTEVFDFIIQQLSKSHVLSSQEVKKIAEEERKVANSPESLKSEEACIMEGSFSYLLNALCFYKKNCCFISIYKTDGVSIGITSLQNNNEMKALQQNHTVLSEQPFSKIGVKKISTLENISHYEVVQAIYTKDNIAFLSFEKIDNNKNKLLGFVKYIYAKNNENLKIQ